MGGHLSQAEVRSQLRCTCWNLDGGPFTSDPTRRGRYGVTKQDGMLRWGTDFQGEYRENPASLGLILLAGNDKLHLPNDASLAVLGSKV